MPARPALPLAAKPVLWLALLCLLLGADGALAQGMGMGGGGRPGGGAGVKPQGPREVGVATPAREKIPYTPTLPGRAVAYEEADARPGVSGITEEVAYQPGQPVEAGALLFRIEDDSYAAA